MLKMLVMKGLNDFETAVLIKSFVLFVALSYFNSVLITFDLATAYS